MEKNIYISLRCLYVIKGKRNKLLFILFSIIILLSSLNHNHAEAAPYSIKGVPYDIKTKRYERTPDNRTVRIEFGVIEGIDKKSAAKINYVLEKEAFKMASSFIDEEKGPNIFRAIDKLNKQELSVWYNISYQDEKILSIECLGESTHYLNEKKDSVTLYANDGEYLVFDIKTGKKLKLSDFIVIDKRIINYKAKNYQIPEYDSDRFPIYYSFRDAFYVYDKKKYEYHDEISVKEALKRLKSGYIKWGLEGNKTLSLHYSFGSERWIRIPYSYIKDFAKY